MANTIDSAVTSVITDVVLSNATGKKWYESKTLWVNVIIAVVILIQTKYGFVIDPTMQALALSGINVVLRAVTKEPIIF